MRKLFSMDAKDYDESWPVFSRPSVRGIIIMDEKVAMVESRKYRYWKFPGGGMEDGESLADTLIREVREEAGLIVIPSSIKDYGSVLRREKSDRGNLIFDQENYYFLCGVEEGKMPQELDDYERDESFTLRFIPPEIAIRDNLELDHGPKERNMIVREARVLELLKKEGYFS